ncbi:hypothetical protein GAO09_24730 [Rhizobiales bacterium RZME27]|jgi:hypothetical protein|uniref:Uncharacterized protein n=1 Tax=Endobacterium cereale TaxID=2663029 RepID=A0A6A8AHF1_9HYPH|nr:hypothetical protein [Endobacterium cereale]MEB2847397.1 hypothetical protein [Endobacterium cereale]MQY49247.1 hypothetical protein [Endobacterium cereale]
MAHILPALEHGHAPITLQQYFRDSLNAFEDWQVGDPEPVLELGAESIPISDIFAALRGCSDIMPANMVGGVTERLTKPWEGEGPLDEMTFSTAARVMSVLVRKRQLGEDRLASMVESYSPNAWHAH